MRQMGRSEGKGSSLVFDTEKDIDRRQRNKSLTTQLRHSMETFSLKVKDAFHQNKAFYQFEKPVQKKEEVTLQSYHKLRNTSPHQNSGYGKSENLNIEDTYRRFKSLHDYLKGHPHAPESFRDDLQSDLKSLSCVLFCNKGFMKTLNYHHAADAKLIEHIAQEQERNRQEQLHQERIHQEKVREHDRGGYSL